MLKKIIKLIRVKGVSTVASELGYKSDGTILYWIRNKKIPKVRMEKVRDYLNEHN